MAKDVINLIKALDIEKPYLLGYSDGGIIALLVAMKASNLLSGIVCCGANMSPTGFHHRDIREIKKEYKKTKDPRTLMMLQEPDITKSDLSRIKVPAMIIAGENDCIKEKETLTISDSIPEATSQILPGENHSSYILETDKIYRYIKGFLGR
jgi:pimeloyl-ACP methyl ester carboxylesterase